MHSGIVSRNISLKSNYVLLSEEMISEGLLYFSMSIAAID